ncbi:hypothetical protein CPB85DRAFT_1445164 [Mucidula mucida]|nr:hypothetical protein CPB85DRAFT_1445164 [Mucidula mucida]
MAPLKAFPGNAVGCDHDIPSHRPFDSSHLVYALDMISANAASAIQIETARRDFSPIMMPKLYEPGYPPPKRAHVVEDNEGYISADTSNERNPPWPHMHSLGDALCCVHDAEESFADVLSDGPLS